MPSTRFGCGAKPTAWSFTNGWRSTHGPVARTVLDLGLLRFTVPDGLVHVLHPRPYMARCEWTE